jgi:iron complex outermembrane receptor protein
VRAPCDGSACEITATSSAVASGATYEDPLRELALGTTRLAVDAARVDEALLVRWIPAKNLALTPALRASMEYMATDAAAVAGMHARRTFARAALQGEWTPSDRLAVRALGSAECNGTSASGLPSWALQGDPAGPVGDPACGQFEPAARVGVEAELGRFTFLANAGRYARVPTLSELYGISGAVRGNSRLSPETGVSVEAGVRTSTPASWRIGRASVDLFAFVRTASDLISYQRSSFGYVRPFNVGSARVAGAEMLAAYAPWKHVLIGLSATVLDPRNTSAARPANDVLPYQPRLALVPRVELRTPFFAHPLDEGKLMVSYFYESSRYADPAGLVVIPEQGSLDVEAELVAWRGLYTVRGRVANLLDQTRFDLVGYPLPGRAAYLAMEAQW